jgi:hypothetical protein
MATAASDIYAFGVMAYAMLAGASHDADAPEPRRAAYRPTIRDCGTKGQPRGGELVTAPRAPAAAGGPIPGVRRERMTMAARGRTANRYPALLPAARPKQSGRFRPAARPRRGERWAANSQTNPGTPDFQ